MKKSSGPSTVTTLTTTDEEGEQNVEEISRAILTLAGFSLAGHLPGPFQQFGHNQMQLLVSLRVALAIGHNIAHLVLHLFRQPGIAALRQAVFVNGVERAGHGLTDIAHRQTQRRIGGPFLARIELQRHGGSTRFMRMIVGRVVGRSERRTRDEKTHCTDYP